MKDIIRMNQLAGIITEGQARKMMQILNENEGTDIISFLNSNKQELLDKLAERWEWDEDDREEYASEEIVTGANAEGDEDVEIAGFGEMGLDFSFDPSKVEDEYGESSTFKLVIAGKPVYAISYNV